MYQTNYHRASSVDEAVKLLAEGDDARLLAGGMTLIPAMKTRLSAPSDLIDIRHIDELQGIEISGRDVTIKAGTTHHAISTNEQLAAACPALSHMAKHIGDPQIRHLGTIGGSLANNDPAADYPAAMLALDASIRTNKREIAAADFFTGLFETALDEDEIILEISFQAPEQCGYEKFRNPASRYAMTGVFVARNGNDVKVAVTGAGDDGVFRAGDIEKALSANFDPSALEGVSVDADSLMSDIHASAEYRANLVVVMAKRAVARANT